MADLDPVVSRALEQIKPGWREHENRMRRYDDAYDVFRVTRVGRPKGQEAWRSNLRIPYAKQVIDTEMVNMVSGEPRCNVRARRPEAELGAKAMQYVLDYFVKEDHLVESQPPFVQSGLIYGVAIAKNHWLYRTTKRPVKTYNENPYDPVPFGVQEREIVTADRPTFEPWNPYHCYWEPGARDVDNASYVVLQSYVSKDDLRKLSFNKETGRGLYHNVEALIATGATKRPDQTAQARAMGFTDGRYKDKFLIEEIWTDDELLTVGNQQVLLRAQKNPYWHGKKPIVIAQPMPDLFEMEGFSETEALNDLQQALLTTANMRTDNMNLTVMRGITYREGGVTDPNMLELRPRFKWGVSDHDDIKPFEVQPLPPEAYNEESLLLQRMQLISGVSPYIAGADSAGVDQNTATGITALQEVASRLLRFKAAQIHHKGYLRTFEQWGDMAQQFLDRSIVHKIVGPGNEEAWYEVTPDMLGVPGHYNYTMESTEESLSRQQERGEAIALLNAFAPLFQAGLVNPRPIIERVAVAYGFENPEAILAPPPQQLPAAAPQQQPTGGTQMSLLGGQTMNPAIQQQVLNR